MSEYRCKRENGGQIIDDTRRSYNSYKRPRFQSERDIQPVTSDGIISPGEVASPTRSVSRSILQALAVISSLYHVCRADVQREADSRRSAKPVANVPVACNPSFSKRR